MISTSTEQSHPFTARDAGRPRSAVGTLRPVPTVSGGLSHFAKAAGVVLDRPLLSICWALGLVLAIPLGVVWGAPFAMIGWLGARRRVSTEGLVGVGELLAPEAALAQYGDGIWRGLWRTQTLGFAIAAVELPTVVLALVPAAVTYALLAPAAPVLPGSVGMVITYGIPALVAFGSMVFVALETMVLLRILSEKHAPSSRLSLGLVFRAAGQAWRAVLDEGRVAVGIAIALLGSAIGAGAVVGLSLALANALELGAGRDLVLSWTAAAAGSLQVAIALEALASWSERARVEEIEAGEHFCLSAWLGGWLRAVTGWLAEKGFVGIGLFVIVAAGVAALAGALARGEALSSWVGLGWFAVTAASLLVLRSQGRRA